MGGAVGRLEHGGDLLERCRTAERDQPLGRQADTHEDGALRDHIEQRLLHLIRHVLIQNVDVEARRVSRANTGAQLAGAVIGPRADRSEIDRHLLPALKHWPLATGQNWDRLVAERYVTDATRCDSNPQMLMR